MGAAASNAAGSGFSASLGVHISPQLSPGAGHRAVGFSVWGAGLSSALVQFSFVPFSYLLEWNYLPREEFDFSLGGNTGPGIVSTTETIKSLPNRLSAFFIKGYAWTFELGCYYLYLGVSLNSLMCSKVELLDQDWATETLANLMLEFFS